MLVLDGGKVWIEFCSECGTSETLTNQKTGEVVTVRALFERDKDEQALPASSVDKSFNIPGSGMDHP